MARYISKETKYNPTIKGGGYTLIQLVNGKTTVAADPSEPRVEVWFDARPMPHSERMQAMEFFFRTQGKNAFGSRPDPEDGQSADEDIGIYRGDPIELRLGLLDTDDPQQCPPQYKQLVEETLDAFHERNLFYIKVEKTLAPKPWPAYDEVKGAGADKKIAALTRDFGLNFDLVVEYEKENANRDAVIAALEGMKAQVAESRREAEALSGTL